jgi:hypothetical protein
MTSLILDQEYLPADRPYSQKELQCDIDRVFNMLRIGKIKVHHTKCDHFYNIKENGRKEKDFNESDSKDVGNCSVCWKFSKTPKHHKTKARNLINTYQKTFRKPPEYLSYENTETQTTFYRWLYEEIK